MTVVALIYFVINIPALGLLILALAWRKTKPLGSKILLASAIIYIVLASMLCGSFLGPS